MSTIGEWWMWLGFLMFVALMLTIDLFFLGGKKAHQVSNREALTWTVVWVSLALFFNLLLWFYLLNTNALIAHQKAMEFFTGYLIEKSLSIDNIFVFLMIFNYFSIPPEYQRRVLVFGVLGAIIMRLILILFGIWIIRHFHGILYIFGVFLLLTGIKMLIFAERKPDFKNNLLWRWMTKSFRVTPKLHKEHFFVRKNGMWHVTLLFLVLILLEFSDLIFAIDSIPAIFSITDDPFIVFTSNIFAILGLRALYFLLANLHNRFYLLKYGLAFILAFIGCKMLIAYWYTIPISLTLGVVLVVLMTSIGLSVLTSKS